MVAPWTFNITRTRACLKFILICLWWARLATPAPAAPICDDFGQCLDQPGPFSRIVPLYGAFSDILVALDAHDRMVARTIADADLPPIAHLPAIGTHMRPNAELILAHKPDLILQMAGREEAFLQTAHLKSLGLNVLTFEVTTFPQLFALTEKLGQLTGKAHHARRLISQWHAQLDSLASPSTPRPKIYYEVRQPQLLTVGTKSIVNAIIESSGGENVVDSARKLVRFNEEALLQSKPDICIYQRGPMNPEPLTLSQRGIFGELPCVKNGREFIVEEREFSRPGPNSIRAAMQLNSIVSQVKGGH